MGKLKVLFCTKTKKPGMYNDGGGLYLRVIGPTSKSWIYRFWDQTRSREMGLGSLHVVGLAEAREMAAEYRAMRRKGIDPIQQRKNEKIRARVEELKSITFRQCAMDYIEANRAGWTNPMHTAQWWNTIEQHAGALLDLPVSVVDTALIKKVLAPIWATRTATASRLRGRIEAVLDYAKVFEYRTGENPARWRGHLDKILPRPSDVAKVEHHPAMPYKDMPYFMARLRARETTAARALEFLILTAGRTGEVLNLKVCEIDLDAGIWTIPAGRMKAGKEHRVPLSATALQLLHKVRGQDRHDLLLFPELQEPYMRKELAALGVDTTVHGFRSTFRDWASEETSFPNHVCEMALAHKIASEVEKAYRRGDLFEKRRELMEAWARYCAGDVARLRVVGE